jgi:hypothetical protein
MPIVWKIRGSFREVSRRVIPQAILRFLASELVGFEPRALDVPEEDIGQFADGEGEQQRST